VGSVSESVNKVYELYSDASSASMYLNKLLQGGDMNKVDKFSTQHPEMLYTGLLRKAVDDFSTLNKFKDQIRESMDLSPDEKRIKIKEIERDQTDEARQILDIISPSKPINKWNILDKFNIFKVNKAEASENKYWIRNNEITESDLQEARAVLFNEVSNRTEPGKQELEAQTILNTAFNRMENPTIGKKGQTLTEILQYKNQYKGYQGGEYKRLKIGDIKDTDKPKLAAIDAAIEKVRNGSFINNIEDYRFYTHKLDGRIIATRNQT